MYTGATTQKDNLIARGNVQQLLKKSRSLVHNCDKLLIAMRDFHYGQARTGKIKYSLSGVLDGKIGKDRWPGREIVLLHESKDRKSTRLNSSHVRISYVVFC